jgi:hypothetical protein
MPATIQRDALKYLNKININRASLFPDLDGYAISLKQKYSILDDSEENLKSRISDIEFLRQWSNQWRSVSLQDGIKTKRLSTLWGYCPGL